jgi:hypothetical protein
VSVHASEDAVKQVVIRGSAALFTQLLDVQGLALDHARAGDDGADHVLVTEATDDAIAAIEAIGLDVEVVATEEQQNELLAQIIEEGGEDVTGIA